MSDADLSSFAVGKRWYASKTIWGAIIAGFSPLLAIALHHAIDPDMASAIASACATGGGILAIYGRKAAIVPIVSK